MTWDDRTSAAPDVGSFAAAYWRGFRDGTLAFWDEEGSTFHVDSHEPSYLKATLPFSAFEVNCLSRGVC